MDAKKMRDIYYSPKGYYKGIAAIKKISSCRKGLRRPC